MAPTYERRADSSAELLRRLTSAHEGGLGPGVIAMIAGTVLSLLVGGGLMALVFHSARQGYDDRIQAETPEDAE